jgi:DNA polymerase III alpha subunit
VLSTVFLSTNETGIDAAQYGKRQLALDRRANCSKQLLTRAIFTPMTLSQRVYSDFRRSGLTIGRHPISFYRAELRAEGILENNLATQKPDGTVVRVAGAIITRQRPGTAKGFVFLSLETRPALST